MADATPGSAPGSPATGAANTAEQAAARGPARSASSPRQDADPTASVLQKILDAMASAQPIAREIKEAAESLDGSFKGISASVEAIEKRVRALGGDMKSTVSYVDAVHEGYAEVAEKLKEIAKRNAQSFDLKDALKDIKEIAAVKEALGRGSMRDERWAEGFAKQLRSAGFEGEKLQKIMKGLAGDAERLGRNSKAVKLTGFWKATDNLSRFGANVAGFSPRVTKRYKDAVGLAEDAARLRKLHKAAHGEKTPVAERHREHLADKIRRKYAGPGGKVDAKAIRENRAGIVEDLETKMRGKGGGRISSAIMARAAFDQAAGIKPRGVRGFMTKAVDLGGGSLSKGILPALGESGIAMAETAAPVLAAAAVPLAVADAVYKAYSLNQKENREVEEKLGGAGIFAGGDAFKSFANARANLNTGVGTSAFLRFGAGYDKNLALAAALGQAGYSQKNLAEPFSGRDARGFAKGGFGTVQRNAYVYGRAAGLANDQATAQTIKLTAQYGQSLKSTEDFFVRIKKDTDAAGISTMKYIDLIDEVNSHYDRSNKLLTATVDTMRLLSLTGRKTADDIKDSMAALTNDGKTQSLPVGAYANYALFGDKRAADRGERLRSQDVDAALDSVARGLGVTDKAEIARMRTSVDQGGQAAVRALIERIPKDAAPIDQQAAKKAIDNLSERVQDLAAFRTNRRAGGMAGALAQAQYNISQGMTLTSSKEQTVDELRDALERSHLTFADLVGNPEKVKSSVMFGEYLKGVYGDESKGFAKLAPLAADLAGTRTRLAQTVTDRQLEGPSGAALKKAIDQTIEAAGFKPDPNDKRGKYDQFREYANRHGDLVTEAMLRRKDPLADALDPELLEALRLADPEAAKKQAEDLAGQQQIETQDPEKRLEDLLRSLFLTVSEPLDAINRLITLHFPSPGALMDRRRIADIQAEPKTRGMIDEAVSRSAAELAAAQKKYEASDKGEAATKEMYDAKQKDAGVRDAARALKEGVKASDLDPADAKSLADELKGVADDSKKAGAKAGAAKGGGGGFLDGLSSILFPTPPSGTPTGAAGATGAAAGGPGGGLLDWLSSVMYPTGGAASAPGAGAAGATGTTGTTGTAGGAGSGPAGPSQVTVNNYYNTNQTSLHGGTSNPGRPGETARPPSGTVR